MTAIARTVQSKGRPRPSFFFCALGALLWSGLAVAQHEVYRCGREYTNTPQDAQRCERLELPTVTVIPGTKVQAALPQSAASLAGADVPSSRAQSAPQRQRDEMARTIVVAELDKARQRHAQLQQAKRQLESAAGADQRQQAQQVQVAIERTERDIESLLRELARKNP